MSLCKCVDSPEPLLPAYTLIVLMLTKIKTAGPTASAWTLNAGFCQYVKNTTISDAWDQQLFFHLTAMIFILLLLSKKKSETWFNIWYTSISITHVTQRTLDILQYQHLIFMISFSMWNKYNCFLICWKKSWKLEVHRYLSTKSCILCYHCM